MAKPPTLSHLDDQGAARMVDVSDKSVTTRTASAAGSVWMQSATFETLIGGTARKGDVLATARIAGIMAAKRTHELIPLCHPLLISKISVEFAPVASENRVDVTATVRVEGKTGVEMEALTAVSTACLTLYDMLKAIDRGMRIGDIRVTEKAGGKSGLYQAS
ncbi:MAG: cyclic pyranopterin monophosphate synthase MoaC [Hyphomicrobiales bacterium]|nr:cyclic pyranopterin monophosphate synthase MoaC [Hyphomicrobiales bacterium]